MTWQIIINVSAIQVQEFLFHLIPPPTSDGFIYFLYADEGTVSCENPPQALWRKFSFERQNISLPGKKYYIT